MDVLDRDFFTDPELFQDPAPWYAAVRERGPVWREPNRGVVVLSGIEEIVEVYGDHEHFSAIVGTLGPLVPLPSPEPGETWREMIERRRSEIPMGEMLTSIDPPRHTRERSLAGKLFTPNRLKENEEFMGTLADELVDEIADRGEVEFGAAYARPFTLLVVADLLGVPQDDHKQFRRWLGGPQGNVGNPEGEHGGDLIFGKLAPYFSRYIEARRAEPSDDYMSRLAHMPYSDGELPGVEEVVRLASILFAAGQETTARLLLAGMRILAEQPALADELRSDPSGIPNFVEECLRLEGPIKSTFRLALEDTRIGDVAILASSTTPTASTRSAATRSATSPSVTANTSAPARASPAPRRVSASSAFWRGSTTSSSWTRARSATPRPSSSAAWRRFPCASGVGAERPIQREISPWSTDSSTATST
jgi:cytochrome P450